MANQTKSNQIKPEWTKKPEDSRQNLMRFIKQTEIVKNFTKLLAAHSKAG